MELVAPDWEILHRLRNRFLNASGSIGLYWESANDLVQYHQYFASQIGWKWDATISQAEQLDWQLQSYQILDRGCGTGIKMLRILEAFGIDKVTEVILWDHSIAATSIAHKMRNKSIQILISFSLIASQVLTQRKPFAWQAIYSTDCH